jgi:HAD superfamily hydrolase (TIGR01490 family)
MKTKKIAAIFDFDGTLIKGNSLPRFLLYYTTPLVFIRKSLYMVPILLKYAFGLADSQTAKERIFIIFFAGEDKIRFAEKAKSFSISVIPTLVRKEAMQKLKWHQEQKHDCILVSASIEDYLTPWAKSTGFVKVLATKMETGSNGNITGKFSGRNCNGDEKLRRVKSHFNSLTEYEIYVYGDSHGDKELLKIADHPFFKSFNEERRYPHG